MIKNNKSFINNYGFHDTNLLALSLNYNTKELILTLEIYLQNCFVDKKLIDNRYEYGQVIFKKYSEMDLIQKFPSIIEKPVPTILKFDIQEYERKKKISILFDNMSTLNIECEEFIFQFDNPELNDRDFKYSKS